MNENEVRAEGEDDTVAPAEEGGSTPTEGE